MGRDLSIVDTPGTNAIDRTHESLTRDYIPRSDLILFLTSAERPLSESERLLLEGISAWGKKTVLVVNKVCVVLYVCMGYGEWPRPPPPSPRGARDCQGHVGFEPM
jgi:predicted GTPase